MSGREVHCGNAQKTFGSKERTNVTHVTWLFFPLVLVDRSGASLAVEELGLRVIPGMQGEVHSFLF